MAKVDVAVRIERAPERVWDVVSSHERMVEWGGLIRRVHLEREGSPDRNGLGAVRVVEAPGQVLAEAIVRWDPPHGYEYRLLRGAPIKDHHGRFSLCPVGTGTEVRWTVEFTPLIPFTGTALALGLRVGFGQMLGALKRLCEAGG